jgi:hypothetical protein
LTVASRKPGHCWNGNDDPAAPGRYFSKKTSWTHGIRTNPGEEAESERNSGELRTECDALRRRAETLVLKKTVKLKMSQSYS